MGALRTKKKVTTTVENFYNSSCSEINDFFGYNEEIGIEEYANRFKINKETEMMVIFGRKVAYTKKSNLQGNHIQFLNGCGVVRDDILFLYKKQKFIRCETAKDSLLNNEIWFHSFTYLSNLSNKMGENASRFVLLDKNEEICATYKTYSGKSSFGVFVRGNVQYAGKVDLNSEVFDGVRYVPETMKGYIVNKKMGCKELKHNNPEIILNNVEVVAVFADKKNSKAVRYANLLAEHYGVRVIYK